MIWFHTVPPADRCSLPFIHARGKQFYVTCLEHVVAARCNVTACCRFILVLPARCCAVVPFPAVLVYTRCPLRSRSWLFCHYVVRTLCVAYRCRITPFRTPPHYLSAVLYDVFTTLRFATGLYCLRLGWLDVTVARFALYALYNTLPRRHACALPTVLYRDGCSATHCSDTTLVLVCLWLDVTPPHLRFIFAAHTALPVLLFTDVHCGA